MDALSFYVASFCFLQLLNPEFIKKKARGLYLSRRDRKLWRIKELWVCFVSVCVGGLGFVVLQRPLRISDWNSPPSARKFTHFPVKKPITLAYITHLPFSPPPLRPQPHPGSSRERRRGGRQGVVKDKHVYTITLRGSCRHPYHQQRTKSTKEWGKFFIFFWSHDKGFKNLTTRETKEESRKVLVEEVKFEGTLWNCNFCHINKKNKKCTHHCQWKSIYLIQAEMFTDAVMF